MNSVKGVLIEDEVVFMTNPNIEFVSLVKHAANRKPFRIIKGQVKGESNMNKVIHSLLVSKDIGDDKLKELADTYSLETKDEEALEGFDVYKQVDDEEIQAETKSVAAVEDGVYAVVADLAEESEVEPTEKQFDYATMDDLADAAFAMMDIVFGTMRQPEATDKQRKTQILGAVDNFKKYAEAVLTNAKAEDVATKLEPREDLEVIKELFKPKEPEEDTKGVEEKLDELFNSMVEKIESKSEEKVQAKIDEFKQEYQEMKDSLNQKLNEELEKFAHKEEVDKEIKDLKGELENLKNTPTQRKSEIEETKEKETKVETRPQRQFTTFA